MKVTADLEFVMGMNALYHPMLAGGVLEGGRQLSTEDVPITATVSKGTNSNDDTITT